MSLLMPLPVLIFILQYKFILSPVPFHIYLGNSVSWLSWQGRIFGEWFDSLLLFAIEPKSALCAQFSTCLPPASPSSRLLPMISLSLVQPGSHILLFQGTDPDEVPRCYYEGPKYLFALNISWGLDKYIFHKHIQLNFKYMNVLLWIRKKYFKTLVNL